jgi:hypothetical protein
VGLALWRRVSQALLEMVEHLSPTDRERVNAQLAYHTGITDKRRPPTQRASPRKLPRLLPSV